jgi:hypothetical protein
MPNPSNPPREVRRDFASLRPKKMPLTGHVFWREGGIPIKANNQVFKPFF